MSAIPSYDLVVIGSGPGGYVAAIRAAQLGLKTAVIEKDARVPGVGLGGSCLHRGCIPTKAMLKSASLLDEAKNHAGAFGVKTAGVELDFAGVVKFRDKVVFKGAKGVEYLMKKHRIDVHAGLGRLLAPTRVAVSSDGGETVLTARNVLVATGSVPRDLPNVKADGTSVLNSDHILKSDVGPEVAPRDRLGRGRLGVRVLLRALRDEDRPRRGPPARPSRRGRGGLEGGRARLQEAGDRGPREDGRRVRHVRTADGTVTVKAKGPDGGPLSSGRREGPPRGRP